MLVAAVTICISSVPISTWQTFNLSASGCFSIFLILQVTTFFMLSPCIITSSKAEPERVNLSPNVCGSTLTSA